MSNSYKFKYGDIIYIKCYLPFDYELGKIISYNDSLNMYVMIHFLDNLNPESFWRWCYVRENDIDLASKITDVESYKKDFNFDVKLDSSNFLELYTDEYELAKKVYEGKLSKADYCAQVKELYLRK